MRIVIALGGNALLRRSDPMTTTVQRRNIRTAAVAIAPLAAEHSIVVVHGTGPQVGLLALQASVYSGAEPYPLDVLDAGTQGMIGYLIQQELRGLLPLDHQVATLLTMIVVDPDDPAFSRPTKFIGPVYAKDDADALAAAKGWTFRPDGDRMRRVVPSPEPQRILEIQPITISAGARRRPRCWPTSSPWVRPAASPTTASPTRSPVTAAAEDIARQTGARITITDSVAQAVAGADFIHTDVWVSMGEPKGVWDQRVRLLAPYQVNAGLLEKSGNRAIKFMHCLPAFHDSNTVVGKEIMEHTGMTSGLEVTDEVFQSSASIVFDQAENRLHMSKAVLVATLS